MCATRDGHVERVGRVVDMEWHSSAADWGGHACMEMRYICKYVYLAALLFAPLHRL